MHALKNLAGHHLGPVVNELLNVQTLPHPDHVVKCFQGIAKDPTLLVQVGEKLVLALLPHFIIFFLKMLAHVCDAMNNSVLYKELGKYRISQHRPMAATAALADILNEPAAVDVFRSKVRLLIFRMSLFANLTQPSSQSLVCSDHGNHPDAYRNECGTKDGMFFVPTFFSFLKKKKKKKKKSLQLRRIRSRPRTALLLLLWLPHFVLQSSAVGKTKVSHSWTI